MLWITKLYAAVNSTINARRRVRREEFLHRRTHQQEDDQVNVEGRKQVSDAGNYLFKDDFCNAPRTHNQQSFLLFMFGASSVSQC